MKHWLLAGVVWFSVADSGGFEATGRHVEFADRFGWRSYAVEFDFTLEKSRLKLEITRRDGSKWKHSCKPRPQTNVVPGLGTSVLVECRIRAKDFAKAVEMDPDDVGETGLLYHAMIVDGKARPGAQRGLYLRPSPQLSATQLAAYAGGAEAPAVVFRSN